MAWLRSALRLRRTPRPRRAVGDCPLSVEATFAISEACLRNDGVFFRQLVFSKRCGKPDLKVAK